jgi:release factor glutamine methyltransferase
MEVGKALRRAQRALASGSDSAASDSRLLLADTLGETTTWVLSHDRETLPTRTAKAFEDRVGRCAAGEPLPYVLGWWEFYRRRFAVNQSVLIPRPETEILVERAIGELRRRGEGARVVDVGTGSGCVAVSLAAEVDGCRVIATDLSPGALLVAKGNAQRNGVAGRVLWIQADLLEGLAGEWDVVCANLPYLGAGQLRALPAARHEPTMALDGGFRGTAITGRLIQSLGRALAPAGLALLEIDEGQSAELSALARAEVEAAEVEVVHDFEGRERLLAIRRGSDNEA